MTDARDYNAAQLQAGHLTIDHITTLVRYWQVGHAGLDVDGMAGPATIALIDRVTQPAPFLRCPLPVLADGRRAQVTSGFRPRDRPTHNGLDWLYEWRTGDVPGFGGDHGAEGRKADGSPAWVVPSNVSALAAADGTVTFVGNTPTGYAVWIDHGNGLRTGYFHLLDTCGSGSSQVPGWQVGDKIRALESVGHVGDNPIDRDGRHLHFELSSVGRYEPLDPTPYLLPG